MDPIQQAPQLIYPKSGGVFLMSELQRLLANVADLVDLLSQRDTRIAQLEAEVAAAKNPNVVSMGKPA
jgi:hypothetical protein